MLGIPPATRVFGQRMKDYGELMEHGEVVSLPKVLDEGDELARCFTIRASAREALEEHAASEAIRRAAATRSRPMRAFEPGTLFFFYRPYRGNRAETAMRGRFLGPAALFGPHGRRSWWVRRKGLLFALLNTCEETRQTRRIALALMKRDSWMSCSRQTRRYRKHMFFLFKPLKLAFDAPPELLLFQSMEDHKGDRNVDTPTSLSPFFSRLHLFLLP